MLLDVWRHKRDGFGKAAVEYIHWSDVGIGLEFGGFVQKLKGYVEAAGRDADDVKQSLYDKDRKEIDFKKEKIKE